MTLRITRAEVADAGEYKCVAKNRLGEASTSASLTIKEAAYKPEFIKKLKDKFETEGEDAEFEVVVTGKPQPKGKMQENIKSTNALSLTESVLKTIYPLVSILAVV